MDLSLLVKVFIVALIVSITLPALPKPIRDDYTPLIITAGIIIIMVMLVSAMTDLFQSAMTMFDF